MVAPGTFLLFRLARVRAEIAELGLDFVYSTGLPHPSYQPRHAPGSSFFVVLQSWTLQWVPEFSEVPELPVFPGSPFLSMAFLFLLQLICFAVVNIVVNGARYIPYLLYSSQQMLVRAWLMNGSSSRSSNSLGGLITLKYFETPITYKLIKELPKVLVKLAPSLAS